ncbi:MAG: polysaccharide biosynthesis tyrosine autokinase [Lachnospiraceae bacterium]|nr:polysaccharide biosynthesis tyrosine autokinase [Lachnospiraceae bacterium]
MNEQKNITVNDYEINIDLYSILKDIWRYATIILLLAASISLLTYVFVGSSYKKQYESSSTFIVSGKGSNNNVYNNLTTTAQMATKFSEVLNSSVLQKKVAKEMDLDYFPGTASAKVITETNLLVLKVQADSPEMAFRLNKAIMDNYSIVTNKLMGNVVLDVLQSPSVPSEPANKFQPASLMKKTFLYTVIALCGLIAIFSFLKDTVRKPKEVSKKLDGKLLETLYHEKLYKTWKARLHRKKTDVLLTNPGTSFRYVENVKKLARKVSSQMKEHQAKTLMVTSFEEGEGKSTVAANLALALAEESEKVLLIDADFRRPTQFKIFGIDPKEIKQFGEVLNGNQSAEDLVRNASNSDLFLVLNSMIYPNSTEMLATPVFAKILDFFKERLDYIVIDTPPMSQVADAEELVDMVDASILVVKQHTALVKDINDAIDVLKSGDGVMLGCVYNDVFQGFAETAKEYGYKYGYGYGYGYGYVYGYGG